MDLNVLLLRLKPRSRKFVNKIRKTIELLASQLKRKSSCQDDPGPYPLSLNCEKILSLFLIVVVSASCALPTLYITIVDVVDLAPISMIVPVTFPSECN